MLTAIVTSKKGGLQYCSCSFTELGLLQDENEPRILRHNGA
jgi:hypothetical protein